MSLIDYTTSKYCCNLQIIGMEDNALICESQDTNLPIKLIDPTITSIEIQNTYDDYRTVTLTLRANNIIIGNGNETNLPNTSITPKQQQELRRLLVPINKK